MLSVAPALPTLNVHLGGSLTALLWHPARRTTGSSGCPHCPAFASTSTSAPPAGAFCESTIWMKVWSSEMLVSCPFNRILPFQSFCPLQATLGSMTRSACHTGCGLSVDPTPARTRPHSQAHRHTQVLPPAAHSSQTFTHMHTATRTRARTHVASYASAISWSQPGMRVVPGTVHAGRSLDEASLPTAPTLGHAPHRGQGRASKRHDTLVQTMGSRALATTWPPPRSPLMTRPARRMRHSALRPRRCNLL